MGIIHSLIELSMTDKPLTQETIQTIKPATQNRGTRSYVLRQGRMSNGQRRALENYYDDYVLSEQAIENLPASFATQQPIICSIGFGMGEALIQQALKNPNKNFFGIEVHAPGVGSLIEGLVEHQIANVLIAHRDVTTVINLLPEKSIDVWQIFFPDPWRKKRHHKRRLIQTEFLNTLMPKTIAGGFLHIATDWENYAEHCAEVLEAHLQWQNTAIKTDENYPCLPEKQCYELREQTKYERRGLRLGHTICDFYYQLS